MNTDEKALLLDIRKSLCKVILRVAKTARESGMPELDFASTVLAGISDLSAELASLLVSREFFVEHMAGDRYDYHYKKLEEEGMDDE